MSTDISASTTSTSEARRKERPPPPPPDPTTATTSTATAPTAPTAPTAAQQAQAAERATDRVEQHPSAQASARSSGGRAGRDSSAPRLPSTGQPAIDRQRALDALYNGAGPRTAPAAPPAADAAVDASAAHAVTDKSAGKVTTAAARGTLDERMQRAQVPNAQRRRIQEELARLEPAARQRQERLLDRALASPNGQRAVATFDRLNQLQARATPAERARLTDDVKESLVRGVAEARTTTTTGQRGVLGPDQAERAARNLMRMSPADHATTRGALDRAGSETERALLLKATAAGRSAADVSRFADAIRGVPRDELISRTTVLGIDGRRGPNTDNLAAGNNHRGVGHYQRFEDSCGPTTAQMVRAERDPIYAMRLNEQGTTASHDTDLAREQRAVLERNGGVAVTRAGTQAEAQLRSDLDSPWGRRNLSRDERNAVRRTSRNERLTPAQERHAQAGLEKLRGQNGGRPSAADVRAMQANYKQNANGTSTPRRGDGMMLEPALNQIAPSPNGRGWRGTDTNGTRGAGMNDRDIDSAERRLQNGVEVPFRIGNPHNGDEGHFMMMSDVRGNRPSRQFLVSDPWSGRTAWVPERDLRSRSNGWPARHFGLSPTTAVTTTYAER